MLRPHTNPLTFPPPLSLLSLNTSNLAEGSPAVARVELRAPGLVRASVVAAGEVSVERAVSSGFDGVTVALTSKVRREGEMFGVWRWFF